MFNGQHMKPWVWFVSLWMASLSVTFLFIYSLKWILKWIG